MKLATGLCVALYKQIYPNDKGPSIKYVRKSLPIPPPPPPVYATRTQWP